MGLIDLHAHVLPGFDDGPRDMAEALALLRQAEESGIDRVVASPHAFDGRYDNDAAEVRVAVTELQAAARQAGLGIQVLPGMEVHLHLDLVRQLRSGHALGINGGPFVCLELPHSEVPVYTEEALFDMQVAGFRPIINHPERNRAIQEKPERFRRLVELGALGMATAGSLHGHFGRNARNTVGVLLREGLVQCLVTDGHRVGLRAASLGDAPEELERLVGAQRARWMMHAAPFAVLAGRTEDLGVFGGRLPGPAPAVGAARVSQDIRLGSSRGAGPFAGLLRWAGVNRQG
ncbi:MAG: tyrosine-protein phosphatase [Symbiobacteriia bacterium]